MVFYFFGIIKHNLKFDMSSKAFKDLISYINNISDEHIVSIRSDKNTVTFEFEGESGEAELIYSHSNIKEELENGSCIKILESKENQDLTTYAIRYLVIFSYCACLASTATIFVLDKKIGVFFYKLNQKNVNILTCTLNRFSSITS